MKILRTCPVCGKKFNPCRTGIRQTGKYNWREVTCSFVCGQEYLTSKEEDKTINNAETFIESISDDISSMEMLDEIIDENEDLSDDVELFNDLDE